MDTKKEFKRIMAEQNEIALATSVNNIPDVRIVNFYYDPDANLLYFSTIKENTKEKEMAENPNVAFTTIPNKKFEHVKAHGKATKSSQTIFDMADKFVSKMPFYQHTLDTIGKTETLILYQIKLEDARVTLSAGDSGSLDF